ncbi:MAG TPA: HD domain-containing protein [Gemmatimonadaceae bacterium]|nr:HD domain-containing protein [Gemmatimonadaceae bacterium]
MPGAAAPRLDIPALAVGDAVQHSLRVADRAEKQTGNGDPYVVLSLANASGSIDTEPIWSNLLAEGWAEGADRGAVVQAIGQVSLYRGKRQLRLSRPVRPLPKEQLDLREFLPHIAEEPARLWAKLDEMRRAIGAESLRRVLALFFDDESFRLAFERTPASINGHHCMVGGLLLHVWEVAYIARGIAKAMRANEDLVIAGVLLHDIGKVEAYDVSWDGFVRTPAGNCIEHVVLGAMMLDERLRRAAAAAGAPVVSESQRLELVHGILSHHGKLEFGSPVRPLTLEAEIVHHADDASAKSADVADASADADAFRGGAEFADRSRLWRVEKRAIWHPPHRWD